MVSSFNTNERYIFMKGNRCHSIPYRFLDSLRIRNRHPWCHSPCRKGSYSHHPSRRHSNSSRLRRCRRHRKLVPGQYCRGSGIRRTSRPGYSGHNSLPGRRQTFGKRERWLCSSYCYHCLQTSWTGFSYAFSEKQELNFCDYLWVHVWLRDEFQFHCSDSWGPHSLSCLFPPCWTPVLLSAIEAGAEVEFWRVPHLQDFPRWTGLASVHTWNDYC